MKKHLLIIILVLISSNSFSQIKVNETYYIERAVLVPRVNINGTKILDQEETLLSQWLVSVEKIIDEKVILSVLPWDENNKIFNINTVEENVKKNETIVFDGVEKKFYLLDDTTLLNKKSTKLITGRFVFGPVTVPIKVLFASKSRDSEGNRHRPFNFTANINLGISAGYRFELRKKDDNIQSFDIIGGVSITSIPIDSSTTRGFTKSSTNASAFTPFMGFVYHYNTFQFGGFLGWDHLSGTLHDKYVYNARPWFGIGIGVSLFNPEKEKVITPGKKNE